jgi:serine protease
VALTVTTAPQGVANGGFETGTLSSWTASGAFLPRVSTTAHTGGSSAQIGSAGPVNGNSTLTQSVAIPAGNSRLTFWYQPHCTDTVTYDQIQAQIRSASGTTLATALNVCPTGTAWTQVTFDTSAYAGQTVVLWFNDHDDGYAGDPTYFLLDDVAVASYVPTANGVQNGGFETGSLASWSAGGAFVPRISTTAHTGGSSAQVGSTGAVNGNSTLTQTVTVPSGSSTLSFWYQPHCTDTLTYDQIQMQIRNTSGATLATVLNVCPTTTAWTNVTFNTTAYAGQSVVLWVNDHDDGYAGDPTYFLVDDVTLS